MPKKKAVKKKAGKSGGKSDSALSLIPPRIPTEEEQLWRARYLISEQQRREHLSNASLLVRANVTLESQMQETERDTVEVVAYLQREAAQLKDELRAAQDSVKEAQREARVQCDKLKDEYEAKLSSVELDLQNQRAENGTLQKELVSLKEFRLRRDAIEKEVEELKAAHIKREEQRIQQLQQVQTKCLEEKARQQKVTEEQISRLAEHAHATAVDQLDLATKSVYEDNARLQDAVKLHIKDAAKLRELNGTLTEKLNVTELELQESRSISSKLKGQLDIFQKRCKHLQQKVEALERSLTQAVRELEDAQDERDQAQLTSAFEARQDIEGAQQALNIKVAELKRIKRLARNVLRQRSEVEQFLVDSIAYVKDEIRRSQEAYMKATRSGDLPPLNGTKGLRSEFEAAAELPPNVLQMSVDDMTWEQRAQVLQYFFAKINGTAKAKSQLQRLQQTSSSSTTTSARHQTGTQQLDETLNMLALPAASSLKSVLRQAATAAPRPENEAGDGAFFLTELRV
eukprot:TRINITY_DN10572_c0_g1_i6.p1 TRINITY_DN10572_c0_g1~~TRINITY_DN10572_c0_g1_i6.p1  ORF type:complete len:515 (+),score=120.72 TRINITY_DN10572_c0_g1_i6:82-1626(+)